MLLGDAMKLKGIAGRLPVAFSFLLFSLATVRGALTTNRWATGAGFGKWEDGTKWDNGVPSPANAINFISSSIPGGGYTVTIDAATVVSHVMNSCLTISNLTISGNNLNPHTLFLNNASDTPGNIGLTIYSNLIINAGGSVTITNSRLFVGSPAPIFGGLRNNGFLLLNTGDLVTSPGVNYIGNAGSGRMMVQAGTWDAGYVSVGNGGQGTLTIAGGTTSSLSDFGCAIVL